MWFANQVTFGQIWTFNLQPQKLSTVGNKNYYAMLLPLLDKMRNWIILSAAGHNSQTDMHLLSKVMFFLLLLFQDAEEAVKIAGEIGKSH